MSKWRRFHPSAERELLCIPGQILLRYRRDPAPLREFLHRWNVELAATGDPQFFAALALASSKGDPAFYKYSLYLGNALAQTINEKFMQGDKREVLAEYGLFALPLPCVREALADPFLPGSALLDPQTNFTAIRQMHAAVIPTLERMRKQPPDPLDVALALRWSGFKYAENPYRVQFHGSFLPDFIAFYNTFNEIIIPNSQ
jgi:hypothetical protein